jgi:hypothetical protein
VQPDARDARNQPVGSPARKIASERRILPVFSPARYDIGTLVELAQQHWNVLWIVLEIGINRDDRITRSMINAGDQDEARAPRGGPSSAFNYL